MPNKYPDYFTVKDLKKFLDNVDENLPIGIRGHFGEFNHMGPGDFSTGSAKLVPKGKSWRDMDTKTSAIFEIRSPDLGPDPD